ncbi:multiple sugar transport system permease protein [Fontibacillus solani]|uniref:Multiple sugar transport system permease protein n=1 Tax=Fontibacillus solani TaxID=1572857 RepID=A0A7W3SWS8_9BACL|nr:carbohydrate ABC transporter permease [Fontibacillus solani]MBA9087691.1 multiple sugar transport system permease protein [Fontibacillus solani]
MGTLLRGKKNSWAVTILMLIIGLMMVFPFLWMLSASFKLQSEIFDPTMGFFPKSLNWTNYKTVLDNPLFLQWYQNSIVIVLITILIKMVVVTTSAYSFARLSFKGREIIFLVLLSSVMITPDTTIVARFLQYKYMGLLDTIWVIILPTVFDVYFVFLMRQFFKSLPAELTEAGLIDGASHIGIFARIMLPLAKSPLMTMILISFIWGWNDFMGPFFFISSIDKQMLSVGLQFFQTQYGSNYALLLTAACLAIIPVIFVFSFVQRYFIEGIASTGIKG